MMKNILHAVLNITVAICLASVLSIIPLMLDAKIRLTRAQGNLTQAMLAYMLGRAELQFMMGESYKVVKNKGS